MEVRISEGLTVITTKATIPVVKSIIFNKYLPIKIMTRKITKERI